MLDKIVREEYKEVQRDLRNNIETYYEEAKAKILTDFGTKHKKLITAAQKVNDLWAETKKDFELNGVEMDGLSEKGISVKFKYYYRGDKIKNKELLQLEIDREKALDAIKSKENTIRKVIWGEDLTYDEMKVKVDAIFQELRDVVKGLNDRKKS